ncbi:MAG: molybdopterin-synthase adenylyltransferase MoeB [Xanthomonadales bacterium]|nr:molybdopterin-synthase adenylyltransferase MoeB [Xanthomonadales bacterium]
MEVPPREAVALDDALLLDLRGDEERVVGTPPGAVPVTNEELESRARGHTGPVLLLCARGRRSLAAAERLRAEGLEHTASVAGGFEAWCAAGLPVESAAGLDADQLDRYARHLALPGVGTRGQRALLDARVVLVGAGGLGSPAALYLAAAGVGYLGVIDGDIVERSNLQRQVLHDDARVGRDKARSAASRLRGLNPGIEVNAVRERLDAGNATELLSDADVVLDGSDNFATRDAVNAACVALGVPLVYGAVERFTGEVAVFWPAGPAGGPCYRCLYPPVEGGEDAPDCAAAGVFGVLPGVIGTLQAAEALKLVLGVGKPLTGRLLRFDALTMRFSETCVPPDPACPVCKGAGLRHAES